MKNNELKILVNWSMVSNIEQWIKAAKAGDGEAWNFLYKQYFPNLYSLALHFCGNASEAKDATQNTFIIAYLKLAELRDTSAFESWIKKILTNNCYRILRNRYKENDNKQNSVFKDYNENEIDQKLDRLYSQGQLHFTLAKLPEVLHSTILLRYFSEFQSYGEIAKILSVPVGTIRSRLSQAKIKLTELWNASGEPNIQIFKENQEWNEFYYSTFAALHKLDSYKNRFLNHLQTNIQIIFTNKQTNCGSWLIDREINEDRKFGSWFAPLNIFSSGNISLVEVKHFNSMEYPDHCPENSVFVLYRNKGKVTKMNFYHSA